MRYGITNINNHIAAWSGSFYDQFEASGYAYAGATQILLETEGGSLVRVTLPKGVTFPRTEENYATIDDAISVALNLHHS